METLDYIVWGLMVTAACSLGYCVYIAAKER